MRLFYQFQFWNHFFFCQKVVKIEYSLFPRLITHMKGLCLAFYLRWTKFTVRVEILSAPVSYKPLATLDVCFMEQVIKKRYIPAIPYCQTRRNRFCHANFSSSHSIMFTRGWMDLVDFLGIFGWTESVWCDFPGSQDIRTFCTWSVLSVLWNFLPEKV